MMCYYLNVQFQSQRVKGDEILAIMWTCEHGITDLVKLSGSDHGLALGFHSLSKGLLKIQFFSSVFEGYTWPAYTSADSGMFCETLEHAFTLCC